ncbi:hypothetical protein [Tateyamaria sp.]|uniref:hypothetical protein n=1 Tax=Tateyamaria sp. TaxID=1929288 RepID=UPI003B20E931
MLVFDLEQEKGRRSAMRAMRQTESADGHFIRCSTIQAHLVVQALLSSLAAIPADAKKRKARALVANAALVGLLKHIKIPNSDGSLTHPSTAS